MPMQDAAPAAVDSAHKAGGPGLAIRRRQARPNGQHYPAELPTAAGRRIYTNRRCQVATSGFSDAAACRQTASAQAPQLKAEQLETIQLLAKQLGTMQTVRGAWVERAVKCCRKITVHVKLDKCEDAHETEDARETSQRKPCCAFEILHKF